MLPAKLRWEPFSGKELLSFTNHTSAISSVTFAEGGLLATGARAGLSVWKNKVKEPQKTPKTKKRIQTYQIHVQSGQSRTRNV